MHCRCPEHSRCKTFERQQRTHVVTRQCDRRSKHAGDGADRRRHRKRQADDAAGVDSNETRGETIDGGGDHRFAEQRAIDEQPEQQHDGARTDEHDEALRQDGSAADAHRFAAKDRRQAVKALVEDNLRHTAQEDRGADGDHDQRHRAAIARRLDGEAMQRKPDRSGDYHRKERGKRERHAGQRQENG